MTDVHQRIRARRTIRGMSAILLPMTDEGAIDWTAFEAHLRHTCEAGLTPAVNMDTGYVQLIDEGARKRVLEIAAACTAGDFVAGAYCPDRPGDPFDPDAYERAIQQVTRAGGTPVVFPSHGLNALGPEEWVAAHRGFGRACDRFIGFELGEMFVPYGRIYPLATYEELIRIPACIGAKHSSLSRTEEWARLEIRDRVRPGFRVLTGNDLAIDMVMFGSDYLLGLSTFCPDHFARRDAMWRDGDPRFYELNDILQYLGMFAFGDPVPGYRHDAAMFLHLQGRASSPTPYSGCPLRPESDREILGQILERLERFA